MGRRKKTGGKKRRSGGSLSGIRGTIKSAAGSGTPSKKTWKGRVIDVVFWVATIALAYYVIRTRCSW